MKREKRDRGKREGEKRGKEKREREREKGLISSSFLHFPLSISSLLLYFSFSSYLPVIFTYTEIRKIPYLIKTVKHYWQGGRKMK